MQLYMKDLSKKHSSLTSGAIVDCSTSLKAIVERVVINLRDKNVYSSRWEVAVSNPNEV